MANVNHTSNPNAGHITTDYAAHLLKLKPARLYMFLEQCKKAGAPSPIPVRRVGKQILWPKALVDKLVESDFFGRNRNRRNLWARMAQELDGLVSPYSVDDDPFAEKRGGGVKPAQKTQQDNWWDDDEPFGTFVAQRVPAPITVAKPAPAKTTPVKRMPSSLRTVDVPQFADLLHVSEEYLRQWRRTEPHTLPPAFKARDDQRRWLWLESDVREFIKNRQLKGAA